MRFLVLLASAALVSAQSFTPLIGAENIGAWITNAQLSEVRVDKYGDTYFAGVLPPGYSVPATYTLGATGNYDIIVIKQDAQLLQYRYITIIGSSGFDTLTGMQVDDAGHVFLSGTAGAPDFPVKTRLPGTSDTTGGGFVMRLSTGGDKVDYSVLMPMEGGIALASDGGLYVGGNASAGEVPITTGAYLSTPPNNVSSGYLMRLRASDGGIDFATWLPQPNAGLVAPRRDGGAVVYTAGALVGLSASGSTVDFTTPLQASATLWAEDAGGNLYAFQQLTFSSLLTKYSSQGAVLQSIDLGPGFQGRAMAVSSDGITYLTGLGAASFATRNSLEPCYANRSDAHSASNPGAAIIALNPAFTVIYRGFLSPDFIATTLSPDGRYLYGPATGVGPVSAYGGAVRLDIDQIPTADRLSPACLANGASYSTGPVTPGEIMTIYGSNLGPKTGTSSAPVNGHFPAELADVRVTVDGVPAPILYAQDTQINFIVPWTTRSIATMQICVSRAGNNACMNSWAGGWDPAVFGDATGPLIMLPDGTRATRVPAGGYFTIYLTGTGSMDGPVEDGGISGFPLRRVTARLRAALSDVVPVCGFTGSCRQLPDAEVSYAGNSPGSVWGLTQINIKLPDSISGSLYLTLGFQSAGGPKIQVEVAPLAK